MSLSQIHVLNKIINKQHRKLRRDLKILEIKKNIYNKIQTIVDEVVVTYYDIKDRFIYDDRTLAYAKKR